MRNVPEDVYEAMRLLAFERRESYASVLAWILATAGYDVLYPILEDTPRETTERRRRGRYLQ